MKKFLLMAVAVAGMGLYTVPVQAADEGKITGALIDTKCGAGKDEAAAASHPQACKVKCADKGYEVVSGEKHYKLDDKGNELAKTLLASNNGAKVVVMGTVTEDKIAVTDIKASEGDAPKGKGKGKKPAK